MKSITSNPVPGLQRFWRALSDQRLLLTLVFGFSAGLPYLLASKTLQTWMAYANGSAIQVSAMTLVGIPYSLKFIWAPLLDRFSLKRVGRRRSWLFGSQIAIFASILILSRLNPVDQIELTSLVALCLSFFSATQDIAIDAYRREILTDEELGLGSSLYSMGYRSANWITGGLALILASHIDWGQVYLIMACCMFVGLAATFFCKEPTGQVAPKSLYDAVWLPLKEFFSRNHAILFLIFILLYKLGDGMSGNVLSKFYQELGFTPQEVGAIAKTLGIFSIILGTFVGGAILLKVSIYRALFIFGVLQSLSTLSFILLDIAGHNLYTFAGVVFFEDFSSGLGSAAFMAYMASLTNKNFTATQYALLTSLMAIPSRVISAVAGHLVGALGWELFFVTCAALAIPGLVLIRFLSKVNPSHASSL